MENFTSIISFKLILLNESPLPHTPSDDSSDIQMYLLEEKMIIKMYIYSVPGIIMQRALCHLILILELWDIYYYLHFTNVEAEFQR